jgi:hypothetical protein
MNLCFMDADTATMTDDDRPIMKGIYHVSDAFSLDARSIIEILLRQQGVWDPRRH